MGPGSRDGVEIGPIDPFGRHESPGSVAATTFDDDEYLPDQTSESRYEDDYLIWHPTSCDEAESRFDDDYLIWHPTSCDEADCPR